MPAPGGKFSSKLAVSPPTTPTRPVSIAKITTAENRSLNEDRELLVLTDALDLSQDRVERVFERAIELVALRRLQFIEIGEDFRPGRVTRHAMAALEKTGHVFPGEHGFGYGVGTHR